MAFSYTICIIFKSKLKTRNPQS